MLSIIDFTYVQLYSLFFKILQNDYIYSKFILFLKALFIIYKIYSELFIYSKVLYLTKSIYIDNINKKYASIIDNKISLGF